MPQIVNKRACWRWRWARLPRSQTMRLRGSLANIMGPPNTRGNGQAQDHHHAEFAPDDYRQQIGMDAQAKTTLAPIQPVRTSLCITKARDGSLLLAEMTPQVPGQVDMDGDETPMPAMARVGRAGY